MRYTFHEDQKFNVKLIPGRLQFVMATTVSYQISSSMDRTYPAEIGKNATIWCKTTYSISSRNKNIFLFQPKLKRKCLVREGVQSRYEPHKITSGASRFAEWPPSQSKSSLCLTLCILASATLTVRPALFVSNKKYLAFSFTSRKRL